MAQWSRPPPRIIIVGGSVAGLSLAVMLQAVGYDDWVLLEAQDGIAPQLGAGFVCNANGFRILDQLGISDAIYGTTEYPLEQADTWLPDGTLYATEPSISSLFKLCVGYPMLVMDRQQILQILYAALSAESKSKIVMGARLAVVDQLGSGVRVRTVDGRTWSGDMLIGADGVHSVTRSEMWRIGRTAKPGVFPPDLENKIRCNWRTVFGIAELPSGRLPPGSVHITHGINKSAGVMSVGSGRTYFMLNEALPKELRGNEIPRYTDHDMDEMVRKRWDDVLQRDLRVGELYQRKVRSALVPMAEYAFDRWHFGRIMLLGDAVHKLHHITGQGGNMCIEDAATFVNTLTSALSDGHSLPLSAAQIESVFADIQAARQSRISTSTTESFLAQKLHALSTPFFMFLALHILPLVGFDFTLGMFVDMARAAPTLHGLEVPHRPMLVGFDDTNPEPKGWGKRLVQWTTTGVLSAASAWAVFGRNTSSTTDDQDPSENENTKGSALLTLHMTAIMSIVLVEGWRRSNKLELLQWPIIWALVADLAGVQVATPLFLLVSHFLITTRGRMTYTGLRQPINLSAAHTIGPVVALVLLIPSALSFFLPSTVSGLSSNLITTWRPSSSSPSFVATAAVVATYLLSYTTSPRPIFDTAYIKPIQASYLILAILLAVLHGATLPWLFSLPLSSVLGAGVLVAFAAHAVWLVAMTCDVCQHFNRSTSQIWAHALAVLGACVVLGPGATTMMLWFWRESAMSRRMLGVLAAIGGLPKN
jgi:2-polyprenyl-6-methoxyphenol hydroxylase-like FAD-dependent oxidoreductase